MICLPCCNGLHRMCKEANSLLLQERGTGPEFGSQWCDCQHKENEEPAGE